MTQDRHTTENVSSTTDPGPDLLQERSLLGIFVHVIAVIPLFGMLATGLIYLVSAHEYTVANARNALNWYLTAGTVTVLAFVVMFGGSALPVPETVVFLVAFPLVLGTVVTGTLSFFYWLIATGKAIFGTPWKYPFAYEFISESSRDEESAV